MMSASRSKRIDTRVCCSLREFFFRWFVGDSPLETRELVSVFGNFTGQVTKFFVPVKAFREWSAPDFLASRDCLGW